MTESASLLIISSRNGDDLIQEDLLYFCKATCILLSDLHICWGYQVPALRSPSPFFSCLFPTRRMVIIKLAGKHRERTKDAEAGAQGHLLLSTP